MLPEGWEKAKLEEKLAVLKDGTHFSPQSKSGPFMYLTSKNIRFGNLDLDNVTFISEEDHKKIYKGSPVKYGDVLLTKDGANTGNAAINSLDFEFSLLSSVAYLRGKSEALLNSYLIHLLLSPIGQSKIKSEMAGQAITRLTLKKIGSLTFVFPPLPEQKKIAQILSTWDNAISATERLLENSQQRKKALMQQLLTGKKRLPGFEGDFKHVELSDVANITMGTSPKSESYNDEGNGLPLIQGNADIEFRKSKPRIFTSEITKTCLQGDILLSVRAPVGTVAISNHDACIGRGICSLKATKGNNQDYLYQWMLWYEPRWASLSQGSTFESVNSTDIKSLKLRLPSYAEQQAIANVLTTADQEIEALQKRLDHLKQEKKALMQQLLTGKRRVQVDDAA